MCIMWDIDSNRQVLSRDQIFHHLRVNLASVVISSCKHHQLSWMLKILPQQENEASS